MPSRPGGLVRSFNFSLWLMVPFPAPISQAMHSAHACHAIMVVALISSADIFGHVNATQGNAAMPYHYLNSQDESNPHKLPNILVTQFTGDELQEFFNAQSEWTGYEPESADDTGARFMACFCYPGCLPDSDWTGPYMTAQEALDDMRNMYCD